MFICTLVNTCVNIYIYIYIYMCIYIYIYIHTTAFGPDFLVKRMRCPRRCDSTRINVSSNQELPHAQAYLYYSLVARLRDSSWGSRGRACRELCLDTRQTPTCKTVPCHAVGHMSCACGHPLHRLY